MVTGYFVKIYECKEFTLEIPCIASEMQQLKFEIDWRECWNHF